MFMKLKVSEELTNDNWMLEKTSSLFTEGLGKFWDLGKAVSGSQEKQILQL